jgi:hypothetical protein
VTSLAVAPTTRALSNAVDAVWDSVQLGRCWQSQWEAEGASHHEANARLACAQLVAVGLSMFIIFYHSN